MMKTANKYQSPKSTHAVYSIFGKIPEAMVIEIKKTMSKTDIQQALAQLPAGRKKLDAKRFAGTVKWKEDPIAYQKRMRDEW